MIYNVFKTMCFAELMFRVLVVKALLYSVHGGEAQIKSKCFQCSFKNKCKIKNFIRTVDDNIVKTTRKHV